MNEYVQDKQQGQERPVGPVGSDTGSEAGDPTGAEPVEASESRVEKAAEERAKRLKADAEKLTNAAAELAKVSEEKLLGPGRKLKLCILRQLIVYSLYKKGYTDREIASVTSRDRTTIIHSRIKIEGQLEVGDHLTTHYWEKLTDKLT